MEEEIAVLSDLLPALGEPNLYTSSPEEALDDNTILVVEDRPDMRAFIRKQLEGIYWVIETANGREGMEKFSNLRWTLL